MSWAGIFKAAISVIGGLAGWVVAEFKPAFPLVVVAVIFILYDTWTAYRLDRRDMLRTGMEHFGERKLLPSRGGTQVLEVATADNG